MILWDQGRRANFTENTQHVFLHLEFPWRVIPFHIRQCLVASIPQVHHLPSASNSTAKYVPHRGRFSFIVSEQFQKDLERCSMIFSYLGGHREAILFFPPTEISFPASIWLISSCCECFAKSRMWWLKFFVGRGWFFWGGLRNDCLPFGIILIVGIARWRYGFRLKTWWVRSCFWTIIIILYRTAFLENEGI